MFSLIGGGQVVTITKEQANRMDLVAVSGGDRLELDFHSLAIECLAKYLRRDWVPLDDDCLQEDSMYLAVGNHYSEFLLQMNVPLRMELTRIADRVGLRQLMLASACSILFEINGKNFSILEGEPALIEYRQPNVKHAKISMQCMPELVKKFPKQVAELIMKGGWNGVTGKNMDIDLLKRIKGSDVKMLKALSQKQFLSRPDADKHLEELQLSRAALAKLAMFVGRFGTPRLLEWFITKGVILDYQFFLALLSRDFFRPCVVQMWALVPGDQLRTQTEFGKFWQITKGEIACFNYDELQQEKEHRMVHKRTMHQVDETLKALCEAKGTLKRKYADAQDAQDAQDRPLKKRKVQGKKAAEGKRVKAKSESKGKRKAEVKVDAKDGYTEFIEQVIKRAVNTRQRCMDICDVAKKHKLWKLFAEYARLFETRWAVDTQDVRNFHKDLLLSRQACEDIRGVGGIIGKTASKMSLAWEGKVVDCAEWELKALRLIRCATNRELARDLGEIELVWLSEQPGVDMVAHLAASTERARKDFACYCIANHRLDLAQMLDQTDFDFTKVESITPNILVWLLKTKNLPVERWSSQVGVDSLKCILAHYANYPLAEFIRDKMMAFPAAHFFKLRLPKDVLFTLALQRLPSKSVSIFDKSRPSFNSFLESLSEAELAQIRQTAKDDPALLDVLGRIRRKKLK